MNRATAAVPLMVVAYPVAIVVITRFVPVVRERRTAWFVAHTAAMAALVVAWLLRRPVAAVPNALWLGSSTAWYFFGARRSRPTKP